MFQNCDFTFVANRFNRAKKFRQKIKDYDQQKTKTIKRLCIAKLI